jgi:hypothetical protein
MDEDDNSFPMDFYVEDPSPRPWKFRPEGYLAVILSDDDDGERAANALVADGFARDDFKLYTGKQILANFEVYSARRNLTDKVTGPVVDDSEGRERYLGYAREGRCALWLRLPDEDKVATALRSLADTTYVHARYWGAEKQTDFQPWRADPP